MKPNLITRVGNGVDAATRLVTFVIGTAVASWLLFGALDAIIDAVAS